jgi:transposase
MFRRSVYQAGLGQVRSTLAYKTSWAGGRLVVADRWFASSKTHHDCGGYLADLSLRQRVWVCPACGRLVDRNANAALNLRDWTGPVSDRDVQRGGVAAPVPFVGDHGGQAHATGVGVRGPVRPPRGGLGRDTSTSPIGGRNPAKGYQAR